MNRKSLANRISDLELQEAKKPVDARKASINTMSVTIKALHVDNKQMTLAVFRQLPVGKIITGLGYLSDLEPWGIVRYSFSSSGCRLWVVASLDGVLYRCPAGKLDIGDDFTHLDFSDSRTEAEKSKSIAVLNCLPQLFIAI